MLEQLGAFRDVGVWRLFAGPAPTDRLALAPGDGPQTCHDPSVLRDPAGRRLILVASDCTAAPSRNNCARKLIATWGRTQPVSILQTLPLPFWRQTGLGFSSAVEVRAPRLGSPTAFLRAEFPAPDDAPEDDSVPTPILWLDDASLASWARMLTRPGASSTAHWIEPQSLDPTAARAAGMELPAEERVRPLRQKRVEDRAGTGCVAGGCPPDDARHPPRPAHEAATSGRPLPRRSPSGRPDEGHLAKRRNPQQYVRIPRGSSQAASRPPRPPHGLEVITAVSSYLVAHHGSTLDFAAIIEDPEGFLDRPTGEQDLPFAHITAMFLSAWGAATPGSPITSNSTRVLIRPGTAPLSLLLKHEGRKKELGYAYEHFRLKLEGRKKELGYAYEQFRWILGWADPQLHLAVLCEILSLAVKGDEQLNQSLITITERFNETNRKLFAAIYRNRHEKEYVLYPIDPSPLTDWNEQVSTRLSAGLSRRCRLCTWP